MRLDEDTLIGMSAGHICYSEHDIPARILEAAEEMWESGRSVWTFGELWLDGTTLWHSPERDRTATVSPEGAIRVRAIDDY